MKKNYFGKLLCVILSTFFVVGCASTKLDKNIKVKGKKAVIVDWANRNLGAEPIPEWITDIANGNTSTFKKEFGINNSYVIKFGIGEGETSESAAIVSRVYYNAMRAEELRTKVLSEAAITLTQDKKYDSFANAAMVAKVDLSGHDLVTQFWQEIEEYDEENDTKETKVICYSVYKVSKESWLETLKNYMKSVLPALPDSESQKKMAATVGKLYEETTKDNVKTSEETLNEINSKLDAINASSSNGASPAPKESDIEWLEVLETACNIIF